MQIAVLRGHYGNIDLLLKKKRNFVFFPAKNYFVFFDKYWRKFPLCLLFNGFVLSDLLIHFYFIFLKAKFTINFIRN